MLRKAFTMVELIMTIVVMGILAGGAYVSMAHLYTKASKTKAISDLSFDTTLISSQISSLLYHRVPSTVIGYDSSTGDFQSIYTLSTQYGVLEWIGTDFERYKAGDFSGFVDFKKSDKTTSMIFSPDTKDINGSSLIFAGSFDGGGVIYGDDFNTSFGWHGNTHTEIFEINSTSSLDELGLDVKPSKIYEKYYLLKSAYAIAKYEDINATAQCIMDLNVDVDEKTLFLFYNYYPWKDQTFCADKNSTGASGKVTILSSEAKGFEVEFVNENLQFNLTLERTIRKQGNDINLQISKQKVVF